LRDLLAFTKRKIAGWRSTGTNSDAGEAKAEGGSKAMGLRACLKMGDSPSTVLLAATCVGSASTARCGDALTDPPWQPPKLLVAGLSRIFRQALNKKEEKPLSVTRGE